MAPKREKKHSPILIFSLSTTLKFGLPSAIVISRKPGSLHVRRQFINDISFKNVIDSWFVCPSFRKAFPFMRNARRTRRVSARVNDRDGTSVRRRRCDVHGRDAARGVSRRAETYVGQAFPNGPRFRPICLNCERRSKISRLSTTMRGGRFFLLGAGQDLCDIADRVVGRKRRPPQQ